VKEYPFLFGAAIAAMIYGVAHDYVTWSISPDYYIIGKGIPSAATGFTRDVAILAMKATWGPGLLGAAVLLMANNPDSSQRQLPYMTLLKLAAIPLAMSILCEAAFGILFARYPEPIAHGAGMMTYLNLAGSRFMAVWGMHIGAYGGFAVGLLMAALLTTRWKKRLPCTAAG
jgi:hypothetical protein